MATGSGAYTLHEGDLPAGFVAGAAVAVDTETTGLNLQRDRLCLVQVSNGDGHAHLVRIAPGQSQAPRLQAMLADTRLEVLCHYARFDIAVLYRAFGVMPHNVWCTRTAAKLVRTNTERFGLRDLCADYLGIEITKQQQTSDWASAELTGEQLLYAASDVLYLHQLREVLAGLLERERRADLAHACFAFLPTQARLDLLEWKGLLEH